MVVYMLEQCWEVDLRSTYRRCRFLAKKFIFSDEAHFDFGGYVNKQNCRMWGTENPHSQKRVTVWCGFWSRGIIGPFFFENKQQLAVTVNGGRYRAMLNDFFSQKLKRRILATFGFNSTLKSATQQKLHSMFCALFLKIALSAAELMSFGHLGAAIWHCWIIICGMPSKISVTPTIDALKDNIREAGIRCDRSFYRRCRFLAKKIRLFRWSSFWSWLVCKQIKLSLLGHRKPAYIHWKDDAPKTNLVRILVQRHNWAIFLRKWARRGRYSQWQSLWGHVEWIFVHKNWRGGYWQNLVSTGRRYVPHSRRYTWCFAPCTWRSSMSKRNKHNMSGVRN